MLPAMSTPLHGAGENRGDPPTRAIVVGVVSALGLGLTIAAIWLLGGGDTPGTSEKPAVVAAPSHMADGAAGFDAQAPQPRDGAPGSVVPEPDPAKITPLEVGPGAVADEWREIRGATVRASDASPVWGATVIALQRDVGKDGMAERARTRSDTDGNFTLRMPRGVEFFLVLVPAPGRSRDDVRPGKDRAVTARLEWENGDPTSSALRLVLETGWRLDVSVLDDAGSLRTGVVVKCGSRWVTTDASGRCTLLDLPVGEPSVTLTLQAPAGAKDVTHVVQAPEAGLLVREVKLTVP